MSKNKIIKNNGFTIFELLTATAVSSIVVLSVGMLLADSQRSWQRMYDSVNSDVITDSHVASKAFDAVVRKASAGKLLLGADGSWAEMYYYENSTLYPDRYARFYYDTDSVGQLKVEYGEWNPAVSNPKDVQSVETICSNVRSCVFKTNGRSVQMIIGLDDGDHAITVSSSAFLHNR